MDILASVRLRETLRATCCIGGNDFSRRDSEHMGISLNKIKFMFCSYTRACWFFFKKKKKLNELILRVKGTYVLGGQPDIKYRLLSPPRIRS